MLTCILISRLRVRLNTQRTRNARLGPSYCAAIPSTHIHVVGRNFVNSKFRVAYTFILQYHVLPFLFLSAF
uniref:Uncharacterized protein n=1 Tax=Anopheles arabiensis TaxID=7173 RepID=A0A182IGE9_ANOAR